MASTGSASILAGEPLDGLEVVAPVATAHDVGRYRFVGEQPGGRLGEHEGTHRHAGCQPPCRRTDAHQVIVALGLCGDAYLAGLSSQLGPAHPEDVEYRVFERESREVRSVALVGEFDLCAED